MITIGDIYNILITGVGGQGTVLMGNILREYGMRTPFIKNVVGMETRGVSQREGSVSASARYLIDARLYTLGENYEIDDLISPVIPINDAHLVLGLEPLETIRNLKYISEQTLIILNTHKYYPRNVIIGSEKEKKYPILLISDGKFHAMNLASQLDSPIYIYTNNKINKMDKREVEKLKAKKKIAISKFLYAKTIGIIISSKPGQLKFNEAIALKKQLEKKGKKVYLFLSDNINIEELDNFPIDFYLNTACPGLQFSSSKILNIEDLSTIKIL